MIFTDRKITIRNGKSTINEPVILYRGDYEVSIRFTIMESKFRFKSGVNLVDSEKASHGQLAILTPYGGNVFSEIVKCEDGTVTFTLTKEMIDQLEEVGLYSFQIRLFDYYRESRVSIPPVEFGIEVREPVASEDHDNEVNNAIVGYSIAKVTNGLNEDVQDTFDSNGQYNKTDWKTGDRISQGKLNKIEDAIDKINQNDKVLDKRVANNFNVLESNKADKVDVRLKSSLININDLDDATRKAILNNNNIDINYVLGDGAVRNENIAYDTISSDKLDFIDSRIQYIDYDNETKGKYYCHSVTGTASSDSTSIYPPIDIRSGETYYYANLYAYFCTISYSNGTKVALSENTTTAKSGEFTAIDDGKLYVTINNVKVGEGLIPAVCNSDIFPDSKTHGAYHVSIPCIDIDYNMINNVMIDTSDTNFVKKVIQYIDYDNETKGKYYGHSVTGTASSDSTSIYPPIDIRSGETYYYANLYAYFCTISYSNGTKVALSENTTTAKSGEFTAIDDGKLYVTINNVKVGEGLIPAVSNHKKGLSASKFGVLGNMILDEYAPSDDNSIKTKIINVKKTGGDFSTILDAVKSITDSSQYNQYEIHIYSGVYNLVEEFGGIEWINSISHSNGERQGLVLPDYTHLIGHGSVYIDCVVEDGEATADFAKSVSTINVYKNNRLEGITFRAKNTRYVIHDEAAGFFNLTRFIKNCRFIHYGTISSYWYACKAMGGGLGSGGRYDIINSHFESPMIPFSYHNNANQQTNYMNIDGCTFSGNKSTHQYDIGFGYYKNNTEKTYITVKNCVSDRGVSVYQETSSVVSDNVLEVIEINNIIREI